MARRPCGLLSIKSHSEAGALAESLSSLSDRKTGREPDLPGVIEPKMGADRLPVVSSIVE